MQYDTVIIGGGFYGLRIAQFLKEELKVKSVLVIERESEVMQRASYNNQARIHNGYHYPRSVLTALRSHVNFPIFTKEYEPAILSEFTKYYAVASSFSKVSALQFERFFQRVGSEIKRAPEARALFNPKLIEEVFLVKEYAFNTAKLKEQLLKKLSDLGVDIATKEQAEELVKTEGGLSLRTNNRTYWTKHLINTTYSSINRLNLNSNLPIIPLKHELTEMSLVELPDELTDIAITVMCGPFFSLMPFPAKNLYTLSHVRYTPHSEWFDKTDYVRDSDEYLKKTKHVSHFPQMQADVKRYLPSAAKLKYSGESLWEIKTVLPKSEDDDSRPIMYLKHFGGIQNYICIMGGKIDNIYDVFRELKETYAHSS